MHYIVSPLPLILMMMLLCFFIDAKKVHYVKPNLKSQNCSKPCFLFNNCLKQPNHCFKSDIIIYFLPGKYILNGGLLLNSINNISLFTVNNETVMFSCSKKKSYIAFYNSTIVHMENFVFNGCSDTINNMMSVTAIPKTLRKVLASAMMLYNCESFKLSNIVYKDSYEHGLIIFNAKKSFVISNITFTDSRMLIYFEKLQTNLRIQQVKQTLLLIQNCQFKNHNGFTDQTKHEITATALSLIIYDQKVNKITINIFNTIFTNCICFNDPLITILLSYYGSTHIHFKTSKFLYNSENVAVNVKQIFQGESISFVNDTQYLGHKLYLEDCHMHSNKMSKLIQFNFEAIDRKSFSRFKGELLPFNLCVTESTFVSNTVSELWRINFDTATSLTLLTAVTIRNSHFILNKNMMINFYFAVQIIFCGQNIFSNNVGCSSSMVIISKGNSYFSGVTKFTGNAITGSSVIAISDYVTFVANASVVFESNSLSMNSSLHFALITSNLCSEGRCPCPIQFSNVKTNNSNVDVSNFSLTFKNNTAINDSLKILYGNSLKDCFWLPGTLFPDKHPGELFKSIIKYSGNNVNSFGYPYSLCLCRESIECIDDRLTDDGVYPGQTLNLSFILADTMLKNFMPYLLVAPIKNVTTAPCKVEPSQIRQPLTYECSSVTYTISVDNKNITECSMQLQYEVKFSMLSVYYVKILPCPPGFTFIDQKCQCHPALQYVTPYPICNIDNQSVYRPANSWLAFSANNNEILYVEICPFQYCFPKHSFIQVDHPDMQCDNSRTGVLCGECFDGLSSVFGSSKCKKCSNSWLALILPFAIAGLLLVLLLFLSKVTIKSGNINGFVLYVNILSINSYNIFASNDTITTSFAYVLTSLANLDLGFDLCFYNGMTEYSKTWLQLAFPLYLLCLTQLIVQLSRHVQKLTKLTGNNTISVLATLLLLSYNKILLVGCRGLFYYVKIVSLQSRKAEIYWFIDITIPLYGIKFFSLFIICLVLLVVIIIPLNLTLLFPKVSYRIKYVHYFKPLLDVYQGAFKDNHRYWFGLELILRVIIFGVTALDYKISLILNLLILAGIVIYLCYVKPFNSLKNLLLEWSFLMNAIVLFMLTFYYGKHKTEMYFKLLNFLIAVAFVEFLGIILFSPMQYLSKLVINHCRMKFMVFEKCKIEHKDEMNLYKNLNIPDVAYNYSEFQEELLGVESDLQAPI